MNTASLTKVPVSEKAIFQRLSRHLAHDGLALKKCRAGSRAHQTLGDFYTVDAHSNAVRDYQIDLEGWAREAGLMKEYEELTA